MPRPTVPTLALIGMTVVLAACAMNRTSGTDAVWEGAIPESEASEPSRQLQCPSSRAPGFFNPRAETVTVYVWVVVGEHGAVTDARLPEVEPAERQAVGNQYIGTAMKLARECSFEPAMVDGAPVSVRKRIHFIFEHFGIAESPLTLPSAWAGS